MSLGKYSPTVSAIYNNDQNWFKCALDENGLNTEYDIDGYDRYGYNYENKDRAGYHESAYLGDDGEFLHEKIENQWSHIKTPEFLYSKEEIKKIFDNEFFKELQKLCFKYSQNNKVNTIATITGIEDGKNIFKIVY